MSQSNVCLVVDIGIRRTPLTRPLRNIGTAVAAVAQDRKAALLYIGSWNSGFASSKAASDPSMSPTTSSAIVVFIPS